MAAVQTADRHLPVLTFQLSHIDVASLTHSLLILFVFE